MKKQIIRGITVAMSLMFITACGQTKSTDSSSEGQESTELAKDQSFKIAVQAEVPSIDPSLQTDVIGYGVVKNTGEGLYRLDKEGVPALAGAEEEPTVSEDGKSYLFKLRQDAKWSNGDPVTAEDYVFAWQRTTNPETQAEFAYLYEPIKNYPQIAKGEASVDTLGIKAVSDYELEITLEQPLAYFKDLLTLPTFFPQNKAEVTKNGKESYSTSEKAVYNGAFVLTGYKGPGISTSWKYEKNPNYWDQENVTMDSIDVEVIKEAGTALNLFESGQIDDIIVSGEQAQQLKDSKEFIAQLQSNTMWLQFNQTKKEFQNENVRKAISAAIDRESLTSIILGNGSIPSTSLIPEGMMKNPETGEDFAKEAGDYLAYKPEEAKEYWEKAKKELSIDELTIDILASDTDSSKRIVEYLQGSIEDALPGMKVTVSPVPFAVRLDRSNTQNFDLVMGGWSAIYPDASNFTTLFTSDNANNNGKYSDQAYDEAVALAAGKYAQDVEKRWDELQKADQIIMEDMGVCPLYQSAEAHLRNTHLKGIIPAMAQLDFKYSYITK
ncbi:peptide ABC transporter substrate-binding protein [Enterococcus sp. LJL99]